MTDRSFTPERVTAALSPLFEGISPLYVTESAELAADLCVHGLRTVTFDAVIGGAVDSADLRAVVVLQVDFDRTPPTEVIEKHFPRSRMLLFPLAAFCPSTASVHYALRRVSEVDFGTAVGNNMRWLDMLETSEGPITITGSGARCTVELRDELSVMYAKTETTIAPDEWVAPANYLEVGVVPPAGSDRAAHSITGDLVADGIAVARHKFFLDQVAHKADAAWRILSEVRERGGFPLRVTLADSTPHAVVTATGEDILPALLPLTDTRFSRTVVELAFASEPYTGTTLDWSVNSVMNEAAGGMHVALGTGLRGAHIDFICNRATVTWVDPEGAVRTSPAAGPNGPPGPPGPPGPRGEAL